MSFPAFASQPEWVQSLVLDETASDAECLIPFKNLGFKPQDAYNDFDGTSQKHLQTNDEDRRIGAYDVLDKYRLRYVVGDFNTMEIDELGKKSCRGITEIYPEDEDLPELAESSAVYHHYTTQIDKFRGIPVHKPPTLKYRGLTYCIGQRLIACDMVRTGSAVKAKRVARFIASTRNGRDFFEGYYAPINRIAQRAWDTGSRTSRPYTAQDLQRDREMGGGKGSRNTLFQGKLVMPNFMYFVGINGHRYTDGNGLHQKTTAEGVEMLDFMGAPISKGCIRLEDYPSKFMRWYLPRGARFFIKADKGLYKTFPENK